MTLEKLWRIIDLYSNKEIGLPASLDQIIEIEMALEIKIQGGYRAFLERYGWMRFGHENILGYGNGVPERFNVLSVARWERAEAEPHMRPHLLPVMADGSGNHYCLDCYNVRVVEPKIVMWDHETGNVEGVEGESFAEWLAERIERIDDWKSIQIDTSQ